MSNAAPQAVPLGGDDDKSVVRSFGDASVEVPRLALNADALQALLRRAQEERIALAEEMTNSGREDVAVMLRQEAAVFARYLAST